MSWNLADLFEQVVDVVPDRVAVVCDGERTTFAELDAFANALANHLADAGVQAGDHVGLALHNHTAHVAARFAAYKLRAVPVNLNLRYTPDELRRVLADSGAVALLHEPGLAETVAVAATGLAHLKLRLAVDELDCQLVGVSRTRPVVERSSDDRYVLYTGGTTGAPRGVVWRHEDLVRGALDSLWLTDHGSGDGYDGDRHDTIGEPDLARLAEAISRPQARMLPACPLTHGTAQWVSYRVLLTGGTLVLDPSPSLCAKRVWDLVDAEQVSRLTIVGDAVARPLVDALDAEPHRWVLDSLVLVASGGAVLSPSVRDGLLAHLPGVALVDGFGSSESGGHGRMVVFPGQSAPLDGGLVRFTPDATTAVLDDDLRPLLAGSTQIGRVARRGPIPLGYLGDPERTATTFPVVDGVRWAIPGDLATIDADGRITVLGRGAATINTGGEKVFAEEVEVVLRAHPAVLDAIVVGIPDERWGSRVAAVVAVRPEWLGTLAAHHLDEHCREHLAGFKLPRTMLLAADVRRSASGKADLAWARSVLTTTPN